MNMTRFRSFFALLLALALALAAVPGVAEEFSTKDVKKVAIDVKPDKTVYMLGEEFDPAGGVLTVTYKDKSTAQVPMTDENVTFSGANFSSEGKKSVTIEFGGKSVRLSVTVSGAGYQVTFDENYEGGAQTAVSVPGGAQVAAPEASREGYTLLGWYTDADFRQAYDFSQGVRQDMTLYACWLRDGAETVQVTFDYAFYGEALTRYARTIAAGDAVEQPQDPKRPGYAFDHWALDGEAYDFSAPVDRDITLTACWQKTQTGLVTYVFEAEDTDLTGKVGVTSSGATAETAMILFDTKGGMQASNSRYVAYLYKPQLSIDFCFASDVAVDDATIALRIASELPGVYTLGPEDYAVQLNGAPLSFAPFTLEASSDQLLDRSMVFSTVILAEHVALNEGENVLQVFPINSTAIPGTTYQAVAPMVDCLEITTSAVLTWDAVKGLPAKNY